MAMTYQQIANILYDEWKTSSDEKTLSTNSEMWSYFIEIAEKTYDPSKSDKEWIVAAKRSCGWGEDLDGLPTFINVH